MAVVHLVVFDRLLRAMIKNTFFEEKSAPPDKILATSSNKATIMMNITRQKMCVLTCKLTTKSNTD